MRGLVPFLLLKVIFLLVFYFLFLLTMLKDITCRFTINCYQRIAAILASSLEIVIPYSCYKREGLKCVVKLTTRYYAYYIRAKARCSLVFFNTKRKEIDNAQEVKRLQLLRARAKASQLKLKITKLAAKKKRRELKKITITKELK